MSSDDKRAKWVASWSAKSFDDLIGECADPQTTDAHRMRVLAELTRRQVAATREFSRTSSWQANAMIVLTVAIVGLTVAMLVKG